MATGGFDQRFRPLTAAAAGAGLIALAMIDFAANAWGDLRPSSLELVAIAARTAYSVFLINGLLLLIAYLGVARLGRRLAVILNLVGVTLFLSGTFVVGRLMGRMFTLEAPESGNPPDDVLIFFALAALGLLVLCIGLAGALIAPYCRRQVVAFRERRLKQHQAEEEPCPEE